MSSMFLTQNREKNETIIKIKNKNNNKLPKGLLMEGAAGKTTNY